MPEQWTAGCLIDIDLGPILFNIDINHLLKLKISGRIIVYPVDTAVSCESDTWADFKNKVETDFLLIKNYSH